MLKKMLLMMIVFLSLLLVSCQEKEKEQTPDPTVIEQPHRQVVEANDTIYQMLVYAFADSNNDGVGDFKGIYEHIDYLTYLGVDTIWLSPIHPSPSYHGYDIIDYYDVKSVYEVDGYTFEDLISDLSDHDIDVIMDIAINHASNQHPFFKEAILAYIYDNENDYIDYFDFSKTAFTNPVYGYQSAYSRGVYYDAFYGYASMPAWNFDHPAVKEMFLDVFDYWLNLGVAGFRLDASKHIYDSQIKNIQLLKYYKQQLELTYDDVFFVNEVWSSEDEIIKYYASEMNNLDFTFQSHAKNALAGSNYLSQYMSSFQKMIRLTYDEAREVPFLSNHDIGRIGYGYSENEQKMLASLLLLSPGNSVIYYGDEIMLEGSRTLRSGTQGYEDAAFRTPMLWDSTTSKKAIYIQEGTSGIISEAKTISSTNVSDSMDNPNSLLVHYQKVIELKKTYGLLSTGVLERVDLDNRLISYQVYDASQTLLIIHNTSNQPIEITLPKAFEILNDLSVTTHPVKVDQTLMIPAYSSTIISLSEPLEESTVPYIDDVYIRGTMTNWALSSLYKMSYDNNFYEFILTLSELAEFKLFSQDVWYGYEAIQNPDSSFLSRESVHSNIIIQPGTYLIVFSNGQITISKTN